jgi:internalin A
MKNPENISRQELLAREFENWQKQYYDDVYSLFEKRDESRLVIAFNLWEDRFIKFLEDRLPRIVDVYKMHTSHFLPLTFYGGSLQNFKHAKSDKVEAFLTQYILEARKGDLNNYDVTSDTRATSSKDFADAIALIRKAIQVELDGRGSIPSFSLTAREITRLPEEIGELRNLKNLVLHMNKLRELPATIGNLRKLRNLDLRDNELFALHAELSNLSNLETLELGGDHGNNFIEIPAEILRLKKLKILHIQRSKISEIPSSIANLSDLRDLDLSDNKIRSLPPEIRALKKLKFLGLVGNPLPIPPEILIRADEPQVILDYYFSIVDKLRRPLNESKLVIVGQPEVGKTSLVQKILHGTFDQSQTKTEGIAINRWQVEGSVRRETEGQSEVDNQKSEIKLNIWDFGGQEIMHATHQFFLTKRSLYLLVLDSRLTQEENRVEYWLKIIQSFSDESPILIVGNKTDQHPLDIDRTGLQRKYPNIIGILETSAATGTGIEELKATITKQVNNLQHVRDLLPEAWFTIKTKLEELGRQSNFITHDKYLDLCAENEVRDEISQRTLIGFLHDLGVVLHFQDDPRLEALGILNPQWVTNGVYKILNSHVLFQNKGVLTTSMLDEILNLPEYPHGKRLFIVDMMKKFELCYDIEPDKTFLVPDLLPKDQPNLNFNGVPAFEYAYPVLPSSVITRFIVRMNQHICDGFVWRMGVLLQIGENTVLVKADIEDRKITIAIDGLEHTRRDALSAIRYQLDEIHNSIKGLDPQKKVPIPNTPKAEPLKYEYLLKLERAGQDTLLVENGNDLVTVNVRQMLSAIETEAQRKETGGTVTNIYVQGNVEGSNIVSGNNNVITQRIQNSFNKAEAANLQAELKDTLKQLANAVAVMAKSLPDEQAVEATDDLSKLVDEATKPKPNKKWYSVSINGLIRAAENVEKVGEPVINLSRKVLSLLTGGIVK